MKKYGFFGGCFNPVTKAHVELALEIVNKYKLDKVVFVPMGDKYNKKGLVNEEHRYNMLQIATNRYKELEVSKIELKQEKSLSTLEAFKKIEEEFKEVDRFYIIGADNLYKMIESKDFCELVKNYNYIIIERSGIDIEGLFNTNEILKSNKNRFKIIENIIHIDTSSSKVRNGLEYNDVRDLLDKDVLKYIEDRCLYL